MSTTYHRHGAASFYNLEEVNNSLDMSLQSNGQSRRYTTITLREIRYPLGCPCHPAEPEVGKKQSDGLTRMYSREYMTGLYQPHARPQMTERSDSQDSTASGSGRASFTRFFRRSVSRTE